MHTFLLMHAVCAQWQNWLCLNLHISLFKELCTPLSKKGKAIPVTGHEGP
jgi:hypothetical protein